MIPRKKGKQVVSQAAQAGTFTPPEDSLVGASGLPALFMLPEAEVGTEYPRDDSGRIIFPSMMAKDRYYAFKNLGEEGLGQAVEMQNAVRTATNNAAMSALNLYAAAVEPLSYAQRLFVTAPLAQMLGREEEVNYNPASIATALASGEAPQGITEPSQLIGTDNDVVNFLVDNLLDPEVLLGGFGLASVIRNARASRMKGPQDIDVPMLGSGEATGMGAEQRALPPGPGSHQQKPPKKKYQPAPIERGGVFMAKGLQEGSKTIKQVKEDGTMSLAQFSQLLNTDEFTEGDRRIIQEIISETPTTDAPSEFANSARVNSLREYVMSADGKSINIDRLRDAYSRAYSFENAQVAKYSDYGLERIGFDSNSLQRRGEGTPSVILNKASSIDDDYYGSLGYLFIKTLELSPNAEANLDFGRLFPMTYDPKSEVSTSNSVAPFLMENMFSDKKIEIDPEQRMFLLPSESANNSFEVDGVVQAALGSWNATSDEDIANLFSIYARGGFQDYRNSLYPPFIKEIIDSDFDGNAESFLASRGREFSDITRRISSIENLSIDEIMSMDLSYFDQLSRAKRESVMLLQKATDTSFNENDIDSISTSLYYTPFESFDPEKSLERIPEFSQYLDTTIDRSQFIAGQPSRIDERVIYASNPNNMLIGAERKINVMTELLNSSFLLLKSLEDARYLSDDFKLVFPKTSSGIKSKIDYATQYAIDMMSEVDSLNSISSGRRTGNIVKKLSDVGIKPDEIRWGDKNNAELEYGLDRPQEEINQYVMMRTDEFVSKGYRDTIAELYHANDIDEVNYRKIIDGVTPFEFVREKIDQITPEQLDYGGVDKQMFEFISENLSGLVHKFYMPDKNGELLIFESVVDPITYAISYAKTYNMEFSYEMARDLVWQIINPSAPGASTFSTRLTVESIEASSAYYDDLHLLLNDIQVRDNEHWYDRVLTSPASFYPDGRRVGWSEDNVNSLVYSTIALADASGVKVSDEWLNLSLKNYAPAVTLAASYRIATSARVSRTAAQIELMKRNIAIALKNNAKAMTDYRRLNMYGPIDFIMNAQTLNGFAGEKKPASLVTETAKKAFNKKPGPIRGPLMLSSDITNAANKTRPKSPLKPIKKEFVGKKFNVGVSSLVSVPNEWIAKNLDLRQIEANDNHWLDQDYSLDISEFGSQSVVKNMFHTRVFVSQDEPWIMTATELQSDMLQQRKRQNVTQESFTSGQKLFQKDVPGGRVYKRTQLYNLIQQAVNGGQTTIRIPTPAATTIIQRYSTDRLGSLVYDGRPFTDDEIQAAGKEDLSPTFKENGYQYVRDSYSEWPKLIQRELGVEVRVVTDENNVPWYEFDIPDRLTRKDAEYRSFEQGGKFTVNKQRKIGRVSPMKIK